MNNKHIILNHLAQSKGLRRKELVTFICKLNGYDGHKQGYYGTNLQGWASEGYIVKKDNKWYIGNLGKLYLKHPKQATKKALIQRYKNSAYYWETECRSERKRAWNLKGEVRGLREEVLSLGAENRTLLEANFDADGYEEKADILQEENHMLEVKNEKLRESLKYTGYERDDLKLKANTLTLQPPPSTDVVRKFLDTYGHFTKTELIAIIKATIKS